MSIVLTDVVKQLGLQPGERRCVNVDDYQVEIRRTEQKDNDQPPTLDLWLDIPMSSKAVTIVATRGKLQAPAPFEIHESDLAPE
jgi:hypothetical protein